jgi:phosphate transport system protein
MTHPWMARLEFAADLRMLRDSLAAMTQMASEAIRAATTALLEQDLEGVRTTAALEQDLEANLLAVEQRTFELIARQQPVAGDLRLLVSAAKIGAECRRMGALALHIGNAAARSYPESAIPQESSGIFRRMGEVANRIADGARVTLLTSDAEDAARLEVDDDAMDGLRRALFRALMHDWPHGVETAVNVALLGRYYERFADHAVAIAQSVIFIVTGTKPDYGPHAVD